jgi:hypothetical protein
MRETTLVLVTVGLVCFFSNADVVYAKAPKPFKSACFELNGPGFLDNKPMFLTVKKSGMKHKDSDDKFDIYLVTGAIKMGPEYPYPFSGSGFYNGFSNSFAFQVSGMIGADSTNCSLRFYDIGSDSATCNTSPDTTVSYDLNETDCSIVDFNGSSL